MAYMTLGVMALYLNGNRIEERDFFRRLLTEAANMRIDAYLFTPEDVSDSTRRIYAHIYDPRRKVWYRSWRPFPEVIFDRCRYQNTPRFKKLREFRAKYLQLLYMNRPLANKWVIHQLLWKEEQIRGSLPATSSYREEELARFARRHRTVFIKPINGTGGRGVICVKRLKNQLYLLRGRDRNRSIISPRRTTLPGVHAVLRNLGLTENCLMQQGIDLTLPSGRVHDYRLLMQKDSSGQWSATGCAGRVGAARSVTSNLHGGGKAVPMRKLLESTFEDEKTVEAIAEEIYTLGMRVVTRLESHFKDMCELALDVAVDRSGHVWLLEVNPKPAREVFRRIGEQEIYRNAIIRPLEYAIYLYEQSKLQEESKRKKEKKQEKKEGA